MDKYLKKNVTVKSDEFNTAEYITGLLIVLRKIFEIFQHKVKNRQYQPKEAPPSVKYERYSKKEHFLT